MFRISNCNICLISIKSSTLETIPNMWSISSFKKIPNNFSTTPPFLTSPHIVPSSQVPDTFNIHLITFCLANCWRNVQGCRFCWRDASPNMTEKNRVGKCSFNPKNGDVIIGNRCNMLLLWWCGVKHLHKGVGQAAWQGHQILDFYWLICWWFQFKSWKEHWILVTQRITKNSVILYQSRKRIDKHRLTMDE